MEGAGIIALAALLLVGVPAAANYRDYFRKLGGREAALAEASHGAAMIVLPVVAYIRLAALLPSWFPLAALALMIWGALWLNNGAKLSVGWRDPKLIARALVKIGLAVLAFREAGGHQFGVPRFLDPVLTALGWWLAVTGITKLLLVLRGFPSAPWDDDDNPPPMPHGTAGFTSPGDPGWKL